MTEASTQPTSAPPTTSAGGTSQTPGTAVSKPGRPGGLQTERGTTTIANGVVTKIAGIAAREVAGVYKLGGGVARALGSVTQRLPGGENQAQGVSVETGETEAAVDVTVVVEYGESIPNVAQQIRDNIAQRIEGLTGLQVTQVNVEVNDLHFAGEDDTDE
jgi:uncharacterized alkaline shock family protein YloU